MITLKIQNTKKLRLFYIMIFIMYFIVPILLYLPYIIKGDVIVSGDAQSTYLLRQYFSKSILSGEFPFWNRYIMNGTPYSGDLNQVFYPILWLCACLPLYVKIYVFYAIHIAIGSFFMFLYMKELQCKMSTSVLMGFLFSTAIFVNGYRKEHIMLIAISCYLPVMLFFVERFLNTQKAKFLILSYFALGFSFFLCFPQYQLYLDVTIFIYFVCGMFRRKYKITRMIRTLFLWGTGFIGLIAVQLIPTVQEMSFFSDNSASKMSFTEFSAYSINPIKYIVTFFPKIFNGNIFDYGGGFQSSGFDIEVYMGITLTLIVICGLKKCFNNYYVRFFSLMILGVLIIACSPHIPLLGKLIYHIPLVGSFRAISRVLYIYSIFSIILFGLIIESALNNKIIIKQINKSILCIFACFSILFCAAYILYKSMVNETFSEYFKSNINHLLIPIALILSTYMIIKIGNLKFFDKIRPDTSIAIQMGMICILIILEVLPFSLMTGATSFENFTNSSDTNVYKYIKENIGNHKLLIAYDKFDGQFKTSFSAELGVYNDIPTINTYVALNNPNIYKLMSPNNLNGVKLNASGLLIGFAEIKRNLYEDNDLLSMMGVKYIVDPLNFITDGSAITGYDKGQAILNNSDSLDVNNQKGEVFVESEKLSIESNRYYIIDLDIVNNEDKSVEGYVDFYGQDNYDSNEQQQSITLLPGENKLSLFINSGQVPSNENYIRFVTSNECRLQIRKKEVFQADIKTEQAYKIIYEDKGQKIYENKNAKDILYASEKVVGIKSFDDIYKDKKLYNLSDNSYILGSDTSYKTTKVDISEIKWKNNSVSAIVNSVGDSGFVNFSNNYFPGWHVYIDGKQSTLYEVNGLIQGVKIGKGVHTITFKFEPYVTYIAAGISIATILISIFSVLFIKKKSAQM